MRTRTTATAWLLALTLASTAAHAAGVEPGKANASERKRAQASFVEGRKAYDGSHYDDAVQSFSASLEIVDSPNTRLYLARSLRESGKKAEAYNEFARVEREAATEERYKPAADAAHDEKASLASSLGFVKLDVKNADDATTVTVGGKEVPHDAWSEPVPVAPGDTEVTVASSGKTPVSKTVHVSAGSPTEVTLDPEGSDDGSKTVEASTSGDHTNLRPFAYVAGGVGAVGLLTFVIAGVSANGTYGDLESSCPNGRCPANQADAISRGKTQQTIANVGLVFGVLGAAAGVTLFVISMPKKDDGAAPASSAALRVGPAGASLQGRF